MTSFQAAVLEGFIRLALVERGSGGGCPTRDGDFERRSCKFDTRAAHEAYVRLLAVRGRV